LQFTELNRASRFSLQIRIAVIAVLPAVTENVFRIERCVTRFKISLYYIVWEENIKMDLQGIRRVVVDWIYLAQDGDKQWALVSVLMNIRVP
jgi:hypothetical protein